MKREIMFSMVAIGLIATAAQAGQLSMRFAGGASEVTLAASQSVTVEVLFAMNATDKKANKLTGFDARFDVGPLATSATGPYVVDSASTKLMVTSVAAGNFTDWTAAASTVNVPFNGTTFFLSAGDPNGGSGPIGNATEQAPQVIGSFVLHKGASTPGDLYVVFRVFDPLPALYNGAANWTGTFGPGGPTLGQQFGIGRGNPGDNRPFDEYHGNETLAPLIIHQVPEPGAMALLVLGGLATLRRRK